MSDAAAEAADEGELTRSAIDREWPWQVEIIVPPYALGQRINAMHEFCRGRDHGKRAEARVEGKTAVDATRYCFRRGVFQRELGGAIIAPP